MAASGLEVGQGTHLWRYWTEGKGLARWRGSPHPWTALRDALLSEGVPAGQADGLATNIYHHVTGSYPAHDTKKAEGAVMAEAAAYVPILKWDKTPDGTLIVEGVASDSSIDRDQQIADPAWLDREFDQWFANGGNVREQHNPRIAAGVAIGYDKTDGGQHRVRAEIVDPGTIKKIEKKVLRGFSFSARDARVAVDKTAAGGRIVDGTIYSVDVVDRPANPNCLLTIAKADGEGDWAPEWTEHEPSFTPTDLARILNKVKADGDGAAGTVEKRDFSDKERDEAASKGQAMPGGGFPIKSVQDLRNAIQAIGRAKDPAAAKAHIRKRAAALGREDLIPDQWKTAAAAAKADGEPDEMVHDPADIAQVRDGLIALIKAELDELADGEDELCDVTELLCSLKMLMCWWDSEADQGETTDPYPNGDKDEEAQPMTVLAADGTKPDGTTIEKSEQDTETTDVEKTDAGEHDTMTIADLTKAMDAQKAEFEQQLTTLRAELAEVKATPIPGGPVRTRTHVQKAVSDQRDALTRDIHKFESLAQQVAGGLGQGYAELAAQRRLQLAELDKADG